MKTQALSTLSLRQVIDRGSHKGNVIDPSCAQEKST
jgi:hypothetical protein